MNCKNCPRQIEKKEKQVQIITKDNDKIIGDDNFHWQCWIDYFNNCVKQTLESAKKKAFGIVGQMFKNKMEGIKK